MQTQTSSSSAVKLSSSSQSVLADAAIDFASKIKPSAGDIGAFKELFYTLAVNSSVEERRYSANILARGKYTPRSIAYYFGLDHLEVAAPMLRYSPVFNDRDLVSLVIRSSFEHVRIIAQRNDLQPNTVNAILAADDEDRTLLQHMSSSERLMENPEIRSVLDRASQTNRTRSDHRSAPLSIGLLREEQLTDLSEALLNIASAGGRIRRTKNRRISNNFRSMNDVEGRLLRNAKDLNFAAFAYSVERECRLPSHFTLSVLRTKNAGDLATMLVSLGVSKFIASRIMLILIPDFGRNITVFQKVLSNYQKLDIWECRSYLNKKGAKFDDRAAVFPSRKQTLSQGRTNPVEISIRKDATKAA
ncbi:MAG: DUF2336 domain-containing protein [Rhizobiaceae bacterium]|nr:DUF2336 domain-containing protein [Rhizobiaceae bacterium]